MNEEHQAILFQQQQRMLSQNRELSHYIPLKWSIFASSSHGVQHRFCDEENHDGQSNMRIASCRQKVCRSVWGSWGSFEQLNGNDEEHPHLYVNWRNIISKEQKFLLNLTGTEFKMFASFAEFEVQRKEYMFCFCTRVDPVSVEGGNGYSLNMSLNE